MDGGRKLADDAENAEELPSQNPDPIVLAEILPVWVWELVARKVLEKNSDDHLSLVNSSRYFQDLRESQRTTAHFEQVLPLVAESMWKKEGEKGFPLKEVLKCRLVCKQWNVAVQKVVIDKFAIFGKSFLGKGDVSAELYRIGLDFEGLQENNLVGDGWAGATSRAHRDSVYKFLNYFGPSHPPNYQSKSRNPFFCRKITLEVIEERSLTAADYDHYLQGILSLLSAYGTQVDIFGVDFDQIKFLKRAISLIPTWLSLLPNIKQFEFTDGKRNNYGQLNLDAAVDAHHPLPKLPCLEIIRITSRPLPMLNQLIRQNSHISELRLENPEEYDIFTVSFPSLRTLTICGCEYDIVELLASLQVQWPLETLELENVKFVGGWSSLFQVIQDKFSETLVSFKFELDVSFDIVDCSFWGEDCKSFKLDLPKLKKIHLELGKRRLCLDFLLPMKNTLEEITVSCHKLYCWRRQQRFCSARPNQHVIQYSGFEMRMYESNVWGIFNKLEKFELTWGHSYLRKEWVALTNE